MIQATSLKQDFYRFFDTSVIIKSNSDIFLSLFKEVYKRFLHQTRSGIDMDRKCEYVVLVEKEKNLSQAYIDDQIYTSDSTVSSFRFIVMLIITSINNEIKSHFLFHAASVVKDNKGIMFSAPAGLGKTTLAITLLENDFKILSDDISAFNRKTFLLEPYVRSFSIRENTVKLLNLDFFEDSDKQLIEDFGGDKKFIIDPEDFKENCIAPNSPLKIIFFLEEQSFKKDKAKDLIDRNMYITFSSVSEDFIHDIKMIHGIKEVKITTKDPFPCVKIVIKQHARIISKLEDLCSKYKVIIMNAQDPTKSRDYENENPQINEIPKSEAVILLLKNFWNGSIRSALLRQDYKGNISLLYLDLLEVVRSVKCYKLSIGKFDKMVGKILDIVNSN